MSCSENTRSMGLQQSPALFGRRRVSMANYGKSAQVCGRLPWYLDRTYLGLLLGDGNEGR